MKTSKLQTLQYLLIALVVFFMGATANAATGESLFSQYCSSCHGSSKNFQNEGVSANTIQNAIAGNKGGMGSLSFLTTSDIQSIASYLNDNGNGKDDSSHNNGADDDHDGIDDGDESYASYPNNASLQFFRYFDGVNHAVAVYYDSQTASAVVFTPEGTVLTHYYLSGNTLYNSQNGNSWSLPATRTK